MHEAMRKAGLDPLKDGDDLEFIQRMGRELHLFMVHGSAFGAPGYARGMFGSKEEVITKGLDRLDSFANSL